MRQPVKYLHDGTDRDDDINEDRLDVLRLDASKAEVIPPHEMLSLFEDVNICAPSELSTPLHLKDC